MTRRNHAKHSFKSMRRGHQLHRPFDKDDMCPVMDGSRRNMAHTRLIFFVWSKSLNRGGSGSSDDWVDYCPVHDFVYNILKDTYATYMAIRNPK